MSCRILFLAVWYYRQPFQWLNWPLMLIATISVSIAWLSHDPMAYRWAPKRYPTGTSNLKYPQIKLIVLPQLRSCLFPISVSPYPPNCTSQKQVLPLEPLPANYLVHWLNNYIYSLSPSILITLTWITITALKLLPYTVANVSKIDTVILLLIICQWHFIAASLEHNLLNIFIHWFLPTSSTITSC